MTAMTEWRWPVRRSNAEPRSTQTHHRHTQNFLVLRHSLSIRRCVLPTRKMRFLLKAHRLNAHEATPVASSCEHADVCVRVIRRPGGFRAQQRRRGVLTPRSTLLRKDRLGCAAQRALGANDMALTRSRIAPTQSELVPQSSSTSTLKPGHRRDHPQITPHPHE